MDKVLNQILSLDETHMKLICQSLINDTSLESLKSSDLFNKAGSESMNNLIKSLEERSLTLKKDILNIIPLNFPDEDIDYPSVFRTLKVTYAVPATTLSSLSELPTTVPESNQHQCRSPPSTPRMPLPSPASNIQNLRNEAPDNLKSAEAKDVVPVPESCTSTFKNENIVGTNRDDELKNDEHNQSAVENEESENNEIVYGTPIEKSKSPSPFPNQIEYRSLSPSNLKSKPPSSVEPKFESLSSAEPKFKSSLSVEPKFESSSSIESTRSYYTNELPYHANHSASATSTYGKQDIVTQKLPLSSRDGPNYGQSSFSTLNPSIGNQANLLSTPPFQNIPPQFRQQGFQRFGFNQNPQFHPSTVPPLGRMAFTEQGLQKGLSGFAPVFQPLQRISNIPNPTSFQSGPAMPSPLQGRSIQGSRTSGPHFEPRSSYRSSDASRSFQRDESFKAREFDPRNAAARQPPYKDPRVRQENNEKLVPSLYDARSRESQASFDHGSDSGVMHRETTYFDPSAPISALNKKLIPLNTAFITKLSYNVTDEELRAFFSNCGEMVSCRIIRERDGKSKGYGFVNFVSPSGLERAAALDGRELGGMRLRVSRSQHSGTKVFIGNLDVNVPYRTLLRFLLEKCPMLVSLCIKAGYAFAVFENMASANNAVRALNGCSFDGRSLNAEISKNSVIGEEDLIIVRPSRTLYLRNIPEKIKDEVIIKMFEKYGKLFDSFVSRPSDRSNASYRTSFAFLTFENIDDAMRAHDGEMDALIDDHTLRIEFSADRTKKNDRDRNSQRQTSRGRREEANSSRETYRRYGESRERRGRSRSRDRGRERKRHSSRERSRREDKDGSRNRDEKRYERVDYQRYSDRNEHRDEYSKRRYDANKRYSRRSESIDDVNVRDVRHEKDDRRIQRPSSQYEQANAPSTLFSSRSSPGPRSVDQSPALIATHPAVVEGSASDLAAISSVPYGQPLSYLAGGPLKYESAHPSHPSVDHRETFPERDAFSGAKANVADYKGRPTARLTPTTREDPARQQRHSSLHYEQDTFPRHPLDSDPAALPFREGPKHRSPQERAYYRNEYSPEIYHGASTEVSPSREENIRAGYSAFDTRHKSPHPSLLKRPRVADDLVHRRDGDASSDFGNPYRYERRRQRTDFLHEQDYREDDDSKRAEERRKNGEFKEGPVEYYVNVYGKDKRN